MSNYIKETAVAYKIRCMTGGEILVNPEKILENGLSELFEESFEKLKIYYPYSPMAERLEKKFRHHAKLFENALKTAPNRAEKLYILDKQSVWLHRSIRKIQELIASAEMRR